MSTWTRRRDGEAGWGESDGRWYIWLDHHMIGYTESKPPPVAPGWHTYRVRANDAAGRYVGTWKNVAQAASLLVGAADGDLPITDDMVWAALEGQMEFDAEDLNEERPRDDLYFQEQMRSALRRAAPLIIASRVLAVPSLAPLPAGVPYLTHEIAAKIRRSWTKSLLPDQAIRNLIEEGVFRNPAGTGENWVLDAMKAP